MLPRFDTYLRCNTPGVRDNIKVFGGDPQRGKSCNVHPVYGTPNHIVLKVTAIGQSVGALDIGLHLTSFGGTQGVPFQQAM